MGHAGPSIAMTFPPCFIVVHPRENRKKCSVEPLRGTEGFVFSRYPEPEPAQLPDYVRLAMDGPLLSENDAGCGLLVLDGTWRLALKMHERYAAIPPRRLPPSRTGYPRVSRYGVDPEQGLATIEAIYVAHRMLGRSTEGLLDHYRFRDLFLSRNGIAPSPRGTT